MNRPAEVEELLKGYPVVIDQSIAWGEMDAYQHVNNVVYFRYFENVRIEYLEQIAWEESMRDFRIGPIVSAVQARFRRPLTYPDTISIAAKLRDIEEDRFHLRHIIVSHGQCVVTTEGEGTVVTFDYGRNVKAMIPEKMRERIMRLEGK